QVQVNTKFLNALPSEWSKFVTDVKLAKSLYTTNYDQLYAYLTQHEQHANEQGEDLIDCINKAMAFLSIVASRFPPSNNQLRTSSNPRNQVTIQDGRVTVQQVQGRQTQSFSGTGNRGIATTLMGNYAAGQAKVVKCYNCLGEGHMAKQCTQPKRPRIFAWFKEKLMLGEAQEAAFHTEDLDAYDSDCDDISSAKAVLMASHSSCDLDVLSEESQNAGIQDTNSFVPNNLLALSLVEQMTDHVANLDKENQTNKMEIVLENQNKELENILCKLYRSTQAMPMLTKPQVFYDNTHKQALGSQNLFHLRKAQRIKPTLSDGSDIAKEHDVIFVIDDEKTLILKEESRSKMIDKQNDPISIKHKINISPIDYSKLNKIKEDFGKHFVTQKELSTEQAFWLKHLNYNPDTSVKSHTPVRIEAPSELPKVLGV
ncbi:retrovirus-related pol polyprotein from transposon TNT 1-94, partial [Tanacetum coccineum]